MMLRFVFGVVSVNAMKADMMNQLPHGAVDRLKNHIDGRCQSCAAHCPLCNYLKKFWAIKDLTRDQLGPFAEHPDCIAVMKEMDRLDAHGDQGSGSGAMLVNGNHLSQRPKTAPVRRESVQPPAARTTRSNSPATAGAQTERGKSLRKRTATLKSAGRSDFVNADATSTTRRPARPRKKESRSHENRNSPAASQYSRRSATDGQGQRRASHDQGAKRGREDAHQQEPPASGFSGASLMWLLVIPVAYGMWWLATHKI